MRMNSSRSNNQALTLVVVCCVTFPIATAHAQSISIFDDFEDGDLYDDNPVSWMIDWGQTSVTDDSLVLSREGGDSAIAKMQLDRRTDWSIRAQVRLNAGSFIGVGIDEWGWMGAQPNGYMTLGVSATDWVNMFVPLNPMQEDVRVQFESTDNMLRAWLWPSESPMPDEPQLEMAATIRPSLPMVWVRDYDGGVYAEGVFRFVQVSTESIRDTVRMPGDFNEDGTVDATDIDLLSAAVRIGDDTTAFDLNHDGLVDQDDGVEMVHGLLSTYFGDANLDLAFNSSDMVQVFATGKYETGEAAGWAEGDWDGNGVVASADMVAAFVDGGYEKGPRMNAVAVPEPGGLLLFVFCALLPIISRHRSLAPSP